MTKGLVQNVTRRQALSYKRYAPNPIGVTSIAAINGRGASKRRAKGRPAPVVVVKSAGKKTRTLRGAKAQSYLRRHHKKHYEKSDFGRLRLAFTTRAGERVSISPKATSRRTSDLAEREARLAKKERALEKKVASKRARRRTVEYVAGARVYKSRAAYERARALLDKKERAARKRRGGKPTAAQLRRAGKTLERGAKAKKRARKTVSRRKSYKHDLQRLPMRAYRESGRIKGSPVIGISEEDVVVVPARRNGKKRPKRATKRSIASWKKRVAKEGVVIRGKRVYGAAAIKHKWANIEFVGAAGRRHKSLDEIRKSRAKSKARRVREADKLKHLVRLEYKGHDMSKDRELRKIAKRYGGKDLGSGFDFSSGYRDMDFGFKTKSEADKAEKSINRVRGVSTSARAHARRVLGTRAKPRRNGHGEDMRANKKRGKKLSGAALAAHQRRIASGKRPAKRTKKGHRRAPHAGKGLLSVKIGGKTFKTYMVKGKGGKVVHVPRYKLLGFKSERALQKVLQGSDEKKAEKISKRLQAIYRKRAKAAERVKKHGDVFTPNARRVSYEDWSANTMKANKRRGKGKGRKSGRGHTKASRRAAARKAAETRKLKRSKRSKAAKKAWRTRKAHSSHKGRKHGRKHAAKRSTAKRGHRKGKHRSRSAAGKARWRAMSAAKKAKVLAALRRGRAKSRGHKKGKGSMALANRGYAANRSSHALANRRHHHRRNGRKFTMNGFGQSVKTALESGAIATAGFIAHRGLGWVLSEKLLSTIGPFQDASTSTTGTAGSMAPYRRIVAGVVVGAAGIILAEKAMPKQANMLAAGIVVSLLQQVIVTALGQVAPSYVPAVSGYGGYGDRSGRVFRSFPGGIGEYFRTGKNGYGEFFLTGDGGGQNGFGATERAGRRRHIAQAGYGGITQAAAGYGAITQAAAGMGGYSQAAAGYGAAPMLSQAAAGVGEYFVAGMTGIGEYEMVQPSGMSGAGTVTDEGIQGGDTNAAERALNIAEGVAGVSDDQGIGVQSIVDPTDVAVPVNDEPGGSRAGILAGQEGIFGGAL